MLCEIYTYKLKRDFIKLRNELNSPSLPPRLSTILIDFKLKPKPTLIFADGHELNNFILSKIYAGISELRCRFEKLVAHLESIENKYDD